jgi:hypothetical protein
LTVTEEAYAGSNLGVDTTGSPGAEGPRAEWTPAFPHVHPPARHPANLDRTNRFELFISRNISVSPFFSITGLPQGEMHSLYWDGVGLNLQWKTSRIKGSVTDYAWPTSTRRGPGLVVASTPTRA